MNHSKGEHFNIKNIAHAATLWYRECGSFFNNNFGKYSQLDQEKIENDALQFTLDIAQLHSTEDATSKGHINSIIERAENVIGMQDRAAINNTCLVIERYRERIVPNVYTGYNMYFRHVLYYNHVSYSAKLSFSLHGEWSVTPHCEWLSKGIYHVQIFYFVTVDEREPQYP